MCGIVRVRRATPRPQLASYNYVSAEKRRIVRTATMSLGAAVLFAIMAVLLVAILNVLYYSRNTPPPHPRDVAAVTTRLRTTKQPKQQHQSLTELSSTSQGGDNDSSSTLTLQDFIVTKYLSRGGVNVAFLARLRSKEARSALGLPPNDEDAVVVLKLADTTRPEGRAEIAALQLLRERVDAPRAAAVGLPLALWLARDVANPYYCPEAADVIDDPHDEHDWGDDDQVCVKRHGAWPRAHKLKGTAWNRVRSLPTANVVVMPLLKADTLDFSDKAAHDIATVKIFFRSMLEQLQVAHEDAQVNNLDLQVSRNMFLDRKTGRSILFDWNSYIPVGKPAVDLHQRWSLAAPEAWLFEGFGIAPLVRSIHAMDTWQSAVVLADFLYYPCSWSSGSKVFGTGKSSLRAKQKYLERILKRIGGNTRIPIDVFGLEDVDLRTLAGMPTNQDIPRPARFKPLLEEEQLSTCLKGPSWYFDDPAVPDHDKEVALDLLQQMFTLSPEDRPTMSSLLQHRFLNNSARSDI